MLVGIYLKEGKYDIDCIYLMDSTLVWKWLILVQNHSHVFQQLGEISIFFQCLWIKFCKKLVIKIVAFQCCQAYDYGN